MISYSEPSDEQHQAAMSPFKSLEAVKVSLELPACFVYLPNTKVCYGQMILAVLRFAHNIHMYSI